MKNVIWVRITKSLCAVFLIFSLLVCAYPKTMVWAAEEDPSNQTPDAGDVTTESYRYLLEIEYSGTFTFIYDWGVWDSNKCEYVASQESQYPAADTTDGMPGWYGFDGVTNKITFTNRSIPFQGNEQSGSTDLYVRLDFHTESWNENGEDKNFPNINPLEIKYYSTWKKPAEGTKVENNGFGGEYKHYVSDDYGPRGCIIPVPYNGVQSVNGQQVYTTTDVYFSLSGAPYLNGTDEMYHSTSPTAIGFIKITIGNSVEDLTTNKTTN